MSYRVTQLEREQPEREAKDRELDQRFAD